jgi:hypothetical protein
LIRNGPLDAQCRKSSARWFNLAGPQIPFFHELAQIEMIKKSALVMWGRQIAKLKDLGKQSRNRDDHAGE